MPQSKPLLTQEGIRIFSDNHLSLYNVNKNALILEGYDPVALLRRRDIAQGNPQISTTEQGLLFYFSSKSNLRRFKKNPQLYIPQFGGWCTYYMSLGFRRKINPKFLITNDKKVYAFSGLIPQLRFYDYQEAMIERSEIAWKLFQQKHQEQNQGLFDTFDDE